MENDSQRPLCDLGITVRKRHRMLFMQAKQHLRLLIAEVVDDAVMQAAEAGARVERNEGKVQRPQHVGDDIAAIGLTRLACLRTLDLIRIMARAKRRVRHGILPECSFLILRR